MDTKYFILSPCGTSILTNHVKNNEERQLIFKYTNEKSKDAIPEEDRNRLLKLIMEVSSIIDETDYKDAGKLSAELNGIIKIYDNIIPVNKDDIHFLLCTDTWLGEEASKLVENWLKKRAIKHMVYIHRHTDLQTKDILAFQMSLSELVKKLSEELPGYSKSGYKIIFNLTGGFKSVQGFLQSIANFYADETVYIFETSSELLRIPKLPIRMDYETFIEANINKFRNMAIGLTTSDVAGIPETLLFTLEGKTILSPWGEIVWEQSKKTIYRKKLLPSPSQRIKYTDKFIKNVNGLPSDRIEIINHRIDQLNRYFEGQDYNPKSLDFKELNVKKGDSTHEMDAWSDRDAKRIFGHFEGDVFILDSIGPHL